jgi:hypothetical protein
MTCIKRRCAHLKWSDVCFPDRAKQEVSPGASRDGLTAIRKTNAIHAWTKIGAAFPHKEGLGFSIELKAFPIDGRLVVLPPDTDDSNNRNGR